MNFTLPEARRECLEQLLEYLGDRADDFKKCFDIESEWCWKYAAIVIDGLKIRKCYQESHHIIPVAYYKPMVKISHRFSASYTVGNLTALTCAEHIMAHYCMFMCARNVGIHAYAFMILYNVFKNGCRKRENAAAALFTDEEVLGIVNSCPRVATVTDAGRTHYYQDPKKARAEWRLANIERIHEYDRYRNKFSRGGYRNTERSG